MKRLLRRVVAAAGTLSLAAPLSGQGLAPLQEGRSGGAVGRVEVAVQAAAPVVGLALVLPAGSALDPAGLEGTARVLAGAVARRVDQTLGPDGGVTRVEVTPERTVLVVAAVEGRWGEALQALLAAAFREAPGPELVAAELAALREVLRFEVGAPILDVRTETRALLYGAGSPAARPPEGTLQGLSALSAADVTAFRNTHYRPGDATLAVVGVPDETRALDLLDVPAARAVADSSGLAQDSLPPDTMPVVPAAPPERAGVSGPAGTAYEGSMPWSQGDRVRIVRDVTSTWITVAYPVPADVPATLLGFVAHRLHEELNPSPSDPGLFSARVEVRPVPGGRALVVEAAVLPDAAERWEARILEAVRALATPQDDAFFRWQRRRFRSATLLADAAPEQSAARRATDLLMLGGVRNLPETVWALDAATLAAGAGALGPPRILVYGPDLEGMTPGP